MACVHSYLNYNCVTKGPIPICHILGYILRDFLNFLKLLYVLIAAKQETNLETTCSKYVITELVFMC